jgi:hypothetical protein
MTRRAKLIGYGIILLWTLWPFIPVFVASAIASHYGARLDEGSAHPCIVNGRDIGPTLYSMGVMGWFGLLTIPTGLLALALFTVMILTGRKSISGIDDL